MNALTPIVADPSAGSVPLNLLAPPSWRAIVRLVALKWCVSEEELLGRRRTMLLAAARHHVFWLLYGHCRMSHLRIGRMIGVDHSTVIYGVRRHEQRRRGELPFPHVWTPDAIEQAVRKLRRGVPIYKVRDQLGISWTQMERCPGLHDAVLYAVQTGRRSDFGLLPC